nr:xylulose kinase-1 [Tanacetum cinerariifolium]
MTTNTDGNLKIRPSITSEEHQQVQREEKDRTILLSALPDEHMCEFYHMIDARDIWNAIKARFGGNAESKKMQKSLLKQRVSISVGDVVAAAAKWNNSGQNLYKLIDRSKSVRTKRGLGLHKYIGEEEMGIDDSVFSIFHTNIDDLEGQPIYNRFASVDHMKAVPPPLIGNYMPPSNIPDIDEPQMVYGKKATDLSEIKTNDDSISHFHDSVLFDFSDRSSNPSTNDFQT